MPDSPASMIADVPIVSSPGHLHISTTPSQIMDGRPPISVTTTLPNGYQPISPNQPLSPILLNGMQLPSTCSARQLSKLKRFLTTLQQFGSDISPQIGEKVRGLILSLISNSISVEEFHQQLQDATNFPLRPFVIPFLKANLPLLKQELLQCSHLVKRSSSPPLQHVSPAENLSASERDRLKKENEDAIFDRTGEKRKSKETDRPNENGNHSDHYALSPNKKKNVSLGYEGDNSSVMVEQLMDSLKQDSDDWRNLENVLQCIMTFVDKAKRSVNQLQDRCIRDREEMASWSRAITADAEAEIKRRANELVSKALKQTDDRVNEVKKRAEEAVSDVKRQAVVELQKAVSSAEEKANDALSQAHQRMEKAVQEARRQATEETTSVINVQEISKENCWNCGRKANETCSGCNIARYCGAFCQHKDWDSHQKDCGKIKQPREQQSQPRHSPIDEMKITEDTEETTSPRTLGTTPNITAPVMTHSQAEISSNVIETPAASTQQPTTSSSTPAAS